MSNNDCTADSKTNSSLSNKDAVNEKKVINENSKMQPQCSTSRDLASTSKQNFTDAPLTRNMKNVLNLSNKSQHNSCPNLMNKSKRMGRVFRRKFPKRGFGQKSGRIRKTDKFKNRRWRPLWKLTQTQFKLVQKRGKNRIKRDQKRLLKNGAALAPHNTSEFIIKEHMPQYEEKDDILTINSDGYVQDEIEQLLESYEWQMNRKYKDYTNDDLRHLWIRMEDDVGNYGTQLKEQRQKLNSSGMDNAEPIYTKIEVFRREIKKLKEKNEALERANEDLRDVLRNQMDEN